MVDKVQYTMQPNLYAGLSKPNLLFDSNSLIVNQAKINRAGSEIGLPKSTFVEYGEISLD